MDHLQTEFSNLVSSLNEDNFNLLIREFNKEYYSTDDVRIVNGPYDGGIDLEIYKEGNEIKRNIQITVQKTKLEAKLKDDLGHARENARAYAYQKNLDFYCTSAISGDMKRAWKRMAQVDYGIELKIFDSKALSGLADNFKSIKKTLYRIFEIEKNYDLIQVDKHTKVLYDMFAIGKDTGELKRQFLHSLIITFIFENQDCTQEQVCEGLKKSINENGQSNTIIQSQIDSLRSKGIIISGTQKFKLDLEKGKKEQIQELLDTSAAQEGLLKQQLEKCLSVYNLVHETKRVVDFIYKSFQANYDADLEELSIKSTHNTTAIKKIYGDLIRFLNSKLYDQVRSSQAAKEILQICTNNEFLNKISASILFTKLFQSNKLESYINQKKELVILDTQILLRLVCLDVASSKPDVSIKSVDDLIRTASRYKSRIFLQTSHDYVLELTKHIQDALKLERFFKLELIQRFGGQTTNVIYNYYKLLVEQRLYDSDLTIHDFVSEILGIPLLPNCNSKEFSNVVSKQIERIFGFMDIEVLYITYHDDFPIIKREYEISLPDRHKTSKAIENDVRSILYLSDSEKHTDLTLKVTNEPFLITWDKSFYNARKKILDRLSNRCYWYIYTPAKFADRLSLQNFQLNPVSINNNIVSLTEVDFNTSSGITFIDLMSSLFKEEDLSKIEIAHKLIELEGQMKPRLEDPPKDDIKEDSALSKVLLEIRSHYVKKADKFGMEDLIPALENNANTELFYDLILTNVKSWSSTREIKVDLFTSLDKLIEKSIPPRSTPDKVNE